MQGRLQALPDAGGAPAVELGGDGAPGREVVGQLPPLAAGAQEVQDGVDEAAAIDFDGVADLGKAARTDVGANELPLLIGQVAGVLFGRRHARIIRTRSICKPPLRNSNKNPSEGSRNKSWPVAVSGRRDGSTAACHTGFSVGGLARPRTGTVRPPSGSCPTRCREAPAAAPGGPRCAAP